MEDEETLQKAKYSVAADTDAERLNSLQAHLDNCFTKMIMLGKMEFKQYTESHPIHGEVHHLDVYCEPKVKEQSWWFILGFCWGRSSNTSACHE